MPDEEDPKRQVKVYLRASVQDRLKKLAEVRQLTMSAVIADLVMKAKA